MPRVTGLIEEISGAVIRLYVGVDRQRQILLAKHNFPVPVPIVVRAQVDTGSGVTAVAPQILETLDLRPIGKKPVITPSTGATPHECNEFVASLWLADYGMGLHYPVANVIASVFLPEEQIEALIGRDLLAQCAFLYDGRAGQFEFDF
jgi:hypothetical protein